MVIAIIAILAGMLLPALSKAKEAGRATVCRNSMRQITLGMILYVDDSQDYLPWPGGVNRNLDPDWVWGGQGDTAPRDPQVWAGSSYGFHPEAGSVFSYVTSEQRVTRDAYYEGGSVTAYERAHTNIVAPVYLCPSSGRQGKALRVDFSMNQRLEPEQELTNGQRTRRAGSGADLRAGAIAEDTPGERGSRHACITPRFFLRVRRRTACSPFTTARSMSALSTVISNPCATRKCWRFKSPTRHPRGLIRGDVSGGATTGNGQGLEPD